MQLKLPRPGTFSATPQLDCIRHPLRFALTVQIESLESYLQSLQRDQPEFAWSVTEGKRYFKIVRGIGYAHAFVDKDTGEMFAPKGWSSPNRDRQIGVFFVDWRDNAAAAEL